MQDQQVDQLRMKYGLWIILTGFLLVALITGASIYKWNDVTSVATAIGATTSLVGTVVGSFLGVQVRSAGKEGRGGSRPVGRNGTLGLVSAAARGRQAGSPRGKGSKHA